MKSVQTSGFWLCLVACLGLAMGAGTGSAQDLSMFFPSSALEVTVDKYGNEFLTSPASAVVDLPEGFGDPQDLVIEGIVVDPTYIYQSFTDDQGNTYTTEAVDSSLTQDAVFTTAAVVDDNLWQLRTGALPDMQVLESRAPAGTEDAPQLKTTVSVAQGGTYNIYLWYGDIGTANADDDATNPTPIDAGLEGEDLSTYFQADGILVTDAYGFNLLEVQLGTVTVGDGDSITVIIDDHVGEGARTAYLGLRISEGGPITPPAPPEYDFNVDNKWMVYPVAGRELIMSNGPGSNEDAPTLTTEITVAHAGKYEVIFHFMDSVDNPDEGWIYAKLNDQEAEEYGAMHWAAVQAAGGTTPPYPWIDGSTVSGMFWYTAVMGEVDLAAGESITITVDDVQGSSFSEFMASVFEGVTLRVLEGGPPIEEVQVSPVFRYEWKVDANGNRFTTVAQDESLQFNDVFTDTASNEDSLWRYRTLGIYGAVYESGGPRGTEDCPALKTSVEVAQGGTYEVFLLFGDVSAVGTDDEANPTPIKAAIEGNEMQAYFQWDAEFIGLWGFNIMETSIGKVTVGDGETFNVFIDDHEQVEGNDRRSVYAGLRIAKSTTQVSDWELF